MSAPATPLLTRLFGSSLLRHAPFRMFYFGWIGVALGYTMQATLAAWLMATLTTSTLMVALVQTASSAPSLLFGIAAGALADIVDRRRIILITQLLVISASILLGGATLAGLVGPGLLLVLMFVIGTGITMYLPAQQTSINELVTRDDLPRALALGAAAFNGARAVGPALAGAIAALFSTGSALLASSLFYIPTMLAVRGWKSSERRPGIPETLLSGVRSGLRYVRHSLAMRSLILRNLSFSVCASALWALLPLIARDQLGLGAGGFGLLSASFGAGAVVAALSITRQLRVMSLNSVVNIGVLIWAAAVLLIASTNIVAIAIIGICGAGVAWVGVLAGLSAGTQSVAPAWVRSRAVSVALLATQGSLALGSALWGLIASFVGIRVALAISAGALLALLLFTRRVRVEMGEEADVTPGVALSDLALTVEPAPDDGPVLIELEYWIDPDHRAAFFRTIPDIEPVRRRNGASNWLVFRDLEEDGRFVERFIVGSWGEYTRLRTRATQTDRQILDGIAQFQRAGVPIKISRLIGVNLHAASAAQTETRTSSLF